MIFFNLSICKVKAWDGSTELFFTPWFYENYNEHSLLTPCNPFFCADCNAEQSDLQKKSCFIINDERWKRKFCGSIFCMRSIEQYDTSVLKTTLCSSLKSKIHRIKYWNTILLSLPSPAMILELLIMPHLTVPYHFAATQCNADPALETTNSIKMTSSSSTWW